MLSTIKIFEHHKTIFLSNGADGELVGSKKALEECLVAFRESISDTSLLLRNSKLDLLWENFSALHHPIAAAGGVVTNEKGAILMIYRLGHWDLPKGKVEKKEVIEAAALREVEEECGMKDLVIKRPLRPTYHTYPYKGTIALKTTYWYHMETNTQDQVLVPQLEEGISEVRWVMPQELELCLKSSYPLIRFLLSEEGFIS